MKNGTCPKCRSNDVLSIHEPEPEKRPFVWMPKTEHSQFQAYVCGACVYTEFLAENHVALNEGRRKGYTSS